MTCIDLMSKHSKLQKWSKYKDLHRFHVKPIKTTQNYKSDQITMNCIDLTSKRSKMLSYVAKHSKQQQNYKSNQITTWFASIWCQNIENNSKLQKPKTKIVIILQWICIDLTSNRSKMLSYVSMHSKQHKTTKVIKLQWLASIWCQNILNYKSDQNTKTCIDFMSNRSKQLKTTKAIKLQCIASNWRQNDQKCCVSSQNIQNNAKLQK